jgi:hypothetical protein
MVKRTLIKFRVSYSVILFFLLTVFGLPLTTCFVVTGLFEIAMAIYILYTIRLSSQVAVMSFPGFLLHQYAISRDVDYVELVHITGTRVLAVVLGIFGAWYYIPTILLVFISCADWIKQKRRSK